jgi:hypothetical protein
MEVYGGLYVKVPVGTYQTECSYLFIVMTHFANAFEISSSEESDYDESISG